MNRREKLPKLSGKFYTVLLWVLTLLTVVVSVVFYGIYFSGAGIVSGVGISVLLGWTCAVVLFAVGVVLFFAVRYYAAHPLKAGRAFIFLVVIFFLAVSVYMFTGSDASQTDTELWGRVADVFIYLSAFLLVVSFLAVFCGMLFGFVKNSCKCCDSGETSPP
ncbi:MAG: hypothetical protein LBF79_03990 [Dysgonamonadaceae bacterium]|jgi:hypothetical protein|nr:hypothetical protein [Dysgonamonadaceae bacterium]